MASFSGFKLVGVNPYSANLGAAMDFATFMTNEESQVLRFEMRRQGPSNVKALEADSVKAEPAIAAIVAQAPYADVQRVGQKFWTPPPPWARSSSTATPMAPICKPCWTTAWPVSPPPRSNKKVA